MENTTVATVLHATLSCNTVAGKVWHAMTQQLWRGGILNNAVTSEGSFRSRPGDTSKKDIISTSYTSGIFQQKHVPQLW